LKEFAQHFWLLCVLCHAIHFGLQLLKSNRPLPVFFQHLRVAQIIFDLLFQLRLRHHGIERWLGIVAFFWPNAMTPVNLLNGSLINDALCKRESGSCRMGTVRRPFRTKESKQRS
jgi:hypothetical protein